MWNFDTTEKSSSDISVYTLFRINIFFMHKNQFLGEKLLVFFCSFFLNTSKFCHFVYSDYYIEKITSKSIYVTTFSYGRYHGSRCIDIYDCVNDWASEEAKSCYKYAVRAPS